MGSLAAKVEPFDYRAVRSFPLPRLRGTVTHLSCSLHPEAPVRRYRTQGPRGPGVYPQCVPAGGQPHLLTWEDATAGGCSPPVELDPIARLISPSELEVLRAAANGLTVSESASMLGKGRETIKTQRHRVILKFGARNIAQAVALATARGLLTIDDSRVHKAA
jgi:DNA-binding CsgD family transcriptional regulator